MTVRAIVVGAATTLAVGAVGCTFGGGPTLGYKLDHGGGFVLGAEAGGGPVVVQGNVGIDTATPHGYLRFDFTLDPAYDATNGPGLTTFGGRVGGGFAFAGGGVFAAGLALPVVHSNPRCYDEEAPPGASQGATGLFGSGSTAAVIYLDLRYARGWEIVLNPRIERNHQYCSDD